VFGEPKAPTLSFPDILIESLARTIPDKRQRILIDCNNNFQNEPRAFARKIAPASLNLSTYVSLYSCGYTNVFELGPYVDIKQSKIEFAGSRMGLHVQPAPFPRAKRPKPK